jgi:hypothetical protein
MTITRTKKIAGAAVVASLLAGGIGAAAWADTSSTTTPNAAPSTAPAPTSPAAPAKARSLLGRIDHGAVEIKQGKAWVTVDYDRGKVTSVAPDHITLARPDGQSVTLQIAATTRYRGVTSESELQTGVGARVLSTTSGTAIVVAQKAPAASAAPTTPAAPAA